MSGPRRRGLHADAVPDGAFLDASGFRQFVEEVPEPYIDDAPLVELRRRVFGVGAAIDPGHHLGGVGHPRHPFRRNEAARFDRLEAGVGQPVDQFYSRRRRHFAGFVLQPVARADFDNFDLFRKTHRFIQPPVKPGYRLHRPGRRP